MGQTPTTLGDRFARRDAPEAAIPGARRDHFRDKGKGGQKKAPAAFEKSETPKGDAFAGTGKQVRTDGGYYDPFRKPAQQPVKAAAFAAPVAPKAEKPAPEPAPKPALAPAPEPVVVEAKRAPLHVVAAPPRIEPRAEEPVEVKYQDVKREEAWRKRTARSSSLVLVTGSAAEAAADVKEAPPPVVTEPTPPPAAEPAPRAVVEPPKRRGGGDGGGAGSGGGGGAATAAIARERSFTQDDFVGIALGAAVLTLLLLWLMRGGGQQQPDVENTLVGTQFAATEPAVAPAPAPQPLVDPFGDQPVDLRPTGPIPEPAVEDPQAAVVAAAPAPAAPAAAPVADRTMRAWFCTKGSTLTTGSKSALEKELAEFKSAFAGKELVVRGYADTRGTSVYNAALGGERANVVADFLRANGLNVVDARGIGELDGLADNQNCANQRRVDVFVSGGPGEQPSRTCAPEPEVESLTCG